MKNIHILPTDKPSRLSIIDSQLIYSKEYFINPQNIYITSDEEIKEGNWIFSSKTNNIFKADSIEYLESYNMIEDFDKSFYINSKSAKKIILTTDFTLIKDGVQAIDDEFLEWFVKNPSCEFVEVYQYKSINLKKMGIFYKIIIPQEEPKQETRKICKCKRAYENPLSEICSLCWNELYPNEKDEIKEEDLLELKQETLEEAFDRIYDSMDFTEFDFASFKLGAKWQQEQDKNKFSEEEVLDQLNLLYAMKNSLVDTFTDEEDYITMKWFEQFKKK